MWRHLRTFLLVAPVTALIWVFAEAESLRATPRLPLELVFAPTPGSDRIVDVANSTGSGVRVEVVLEGSAAALDQAERALRGPVVLTLGVDTVPREPGAHLIKLADALAAVPALRDRGISIRSITPDTVTIIVDQLITRDLPVEFPLAGEVDGPPDVKPRTVRLTLPAADDIRLPTDAAAIAHLDDETWSRLIPGRRETITGVRLALPPGIAGSRHARLDPPVADVALTVRTRTASIKLPTVPVSLRLSPTEVNTWEVVVPEQDRLLTDITVSGPADQIRQLQDKALTVLAVVSLNFEELERGIPSKDAILTTDPPSALRFEVPTRTVRLAIKRRPIPTTDSAPAGR